MLCRGTPQHIAGEQGRPVVLLRWRKMATDAHKHTQMSLFSHEMWLWLTPSGCRQVHSIKRNQGVAQSQLVLYILIQMHICLSERLHKYREISANGADIINSFTKSINYCTWLHYMIIEAVLCKLLSHITCRLRNSGLHSLPTNHHLQEPSVYGGENIPIAVIFDGWFMDLCWGCRGGAFFLNDSE